jgi:hypothetical protein
MREPKAPTFEELLAELEAKSPPSPGGKTTAEWAESWGIGYPRTLALIKAAIVDGRMKTASELRPEITRPGRKARVWLHRFVAKGRK